jgi:tetratricopeptide (TPR) repeat protein
LAGAWLWWRSLRIGWQNLESKTATTRRNAAAFLSAAWIVLILIVIQPFVALALFPFIWGVGLTTRRAPAERDALAGFCTWGLRFTAAFVAALILVNLTQFQREATHVRAYGDTVTHAVEVEREGRYEEAAEYYRVARDMSEHNGRGGIAQGSYYGELRLLFGVQRLEMRIRMDLSSCPPATICGLGLGRSLLCAGRYEDAAIALEDAQRSCEDLAAISFLRGEALWRSGRFNEAVAAYAAAVDKLARRPEQAYADVLIPREPTLEPDISLRGLLMAGRAFRLRGEWRRASICYERVREAEPTNAEALYHAGIDAEISGDYTRARTFYARAIESDRVHWEAHKRLAALEEMYPAQKGNARTVD